MKKIKFESKIIELETISPLFIKGKDIAYGEGMLKGIDSEGKPCVYLIDNDKLCEYIYKQTYHENGNRIKEGDEFDYVKLYSDAFGQSNALSLKEFFDKYSEIKPSNAELRNIAKGITQLGNKYDFVQNGQVQCFIPGSSIKGAIRNAILWKIIDDSEGSSDDKNNWLNSFIRDFFNVVSEIRQALNTFYNATKETNVSERKKKIKESAEKIEAVLKNDFIIKNNFFQNIRKQDGKIDFHLVKEKNEEMIEFFKKNASNVFYQNTTLSGKTFNEKIPTFEEKEEYNKHWMDKDIIKNKSLYDFFRIVKISDANFIKSKFGDKDAKAVCVINDKTYRKDFNIPLKCINIGSKALFRITIDLEMAERFFGQHGIPLYLQNINMLLQTVDEFFRNIWSCEEEFFRDKTSIPQNINAEDRKLKVHTGEIHNFYKTTPLDSYLFRTGWGGGFMSKSQFLHLDKDLRVLIRDAIRHNGGSLAPKSRCLTVEGDDAKHPLGWCLLRIFENFG